MTPIYEDHEDLQSEASKIYEYATYPDPFEAAAGMTNESSISQYPADPHHRLASYSSAFDAAAAAVALEVPIESVSKPKVAIGGSDFTSAPKRGQGMLVVERGHYLYEMAHREDALEIVDACLTAVTRGVVDQGDALLFIAFLVEVAPAIRLGAPIHWLRAVGDEMVVRRVLAAVRE
ncbi:MAG: hypothetical protein M1818_007433 [Claussenomyces sp. TS43310]|nr:MAG: hypothetical protein M1818_007433 [Claussenomyces sp. TS43310]